MRVFDGVAVTEDQDVLLVGGHIARVGKNLPTVGITHVVDGREKTLVPGLIDAHAHIFDARQLRESAVFGVTTVLDMGSEPRMVKALKERVAAGGADGTDLADLRSAGYMMTVPQGPGTEYGVPVPTVSTLAEIPTYVDARLQQGSDYLKLIYDDGRAFGIHTETLTREMLKAGIDAAHARDLLAVVHIGTQGDASAAIDSRADGLAHLFVDSAPNAEFAALVRRSRAFVVPTLSVLHSVEGASAGVALLEDRKLAPYLSEMNARVLKQSFPKRTPVKYAYAEETVRQLHAAHVPLLAGTDAPNPGTTYGASIHGELELFTRAGLSPTEALAAATSVAASSFRLTDRGRIAPDLRADLVLVEGDPTTDIRALRRIAAVWMRGTRVDRASYQSLVAKEREEADRVRTQWARGAKAGLVSDFEGEAITAAFGSGWDVSTDKIIGGGSTAELTLASPGAAGSKGALAITGAVAPVSGTDAWSGAMFSPGEQPAVPANLSEKKQLSFWAKGDGRTYAILLFAQSRGANPAVQTFVADKAWKQVAFAISDFDGLDGRDLIGVFIGATAPAGDFALQIDQVEFK